MHFFSSTNLKSLHTSDSRDDFLNATNSVVLFSIPWNRLKLRNRHDILRSSILADNLNYIDEIFGNELLNGFSMQAINSRY